MYWHRMEQGLGRNSIVGTAVKSPELIPENLAADEKHSRLKGEKVCVPTTVGGQCILGASASEDAGEKDLKKGRAEGVLFPTGAQALRMGRGGRDSGGRIQADKETEGEPVELFEGLRSSGMPQDRQHDRQADAENGPPS